MFTQGGGALLLTTVGWPMPFHIFVKWYIGVFGRGFPVNTSTVLLMYLVTSISTKILNLCHLIIKYVPVYVISRDVACLF